MTTSMSIPAIKGAPLLGNMQAFRNDRLNLYLNVNRTCGDIGSFRVGRQQIILVTSADLVQTILVDHAADFEKSPILRYFGGPVLGNGLLTSENEFHKRQRKLIAPAFQHRRISGYADIMASYSEQLQQPWQTGETIDVAHEMMRLTLWIVGKTLFDTDVLTEAEDVGDALTEAMLSFNAKISSPIPTPLTWPTPQNRRFFNAVKRLDDIIYHIIQKRRESTDDHGDLLSILLQSHYEDDGSFMTDQQVRDEVMTLFLAGHETTANAMAWSWYLLTQNPVVYTRLREEVDRVLAGRTPTTDDLPNLPYTLQVLKEAMRLYPPAHMISRQAQRDLTIAGYQIPAGTIVAISPYAIHRRSDYFPDPERFDPERWTPEHEEQLPRHAYMPFGGGPRVCIGNHFAMMEGQIILATLAQRTKFTLAADQRVEPETLATLRPRNGIKMTVERRETSHSA
ncbi:MAG: cytochrome P450 [Chloroflexota bacterium]